MGEDSRESEQRYQQLITTSPAPINLFDEEGTIIWGNDAVLELLGLSTRDDLVGRSIFEFIEVEDRYVARKELTEVVEEKAPTGPTPMTLQRDDGAIRQIRVATAPGRYQGRDVGQAVIIDVTALNESQAKLASQRQFIEEALDTLQDVFYVINLEGELERWNDSLLEVSGYDEDEVRDMDLEAFFVEEHTERISQSIASVLAEGEDVVTATVVTKDGTEIPFEFRKRRLMENGEIVGLVGIGRDISAQRAREQHLRVVDRLLQHNLRNQVNIIRGRAEIIQREPDGDPLQHAQTIDDAADRLLSIFDNHHHIVDLLTVQDDLTDVDVGALLDEVVQESRASYPSAAITTEIPETVTVAAVPVLDKAFRELIQNAIEYNEDSRPRVHLDVEARGSTVVIRCSDDGPLIPEMEYRSFSNPDLLNATSHTTGLGLWFVHWVVKRSNGTLRFEESELDGNAVVVELQSADPRWE